MSTQKSEIAGRASRGSPCPVCGESSKGCSWTVDGMHLCRGTVADPAEWKDLRNGRPDGAGFYHYRRTEDHNTRNSFRPPPSKPAPNWPAEAAKYAKALTPQLREELAVAVKLPVACLDALPLLGWRERDEHGPCWTFPEQDGAGRVVGLSRRYRNGSKMNLGSRGITVPAGWKSFAGPVVLPEGATDVLALHACGVAAIGRPSNVGGIDHLAEILRDVPAERPIAVLGEHDKRFNHAKQCEEWPGKEGAEKTAKILAEKLKRPVRAVLPPDGLKDARAWFHELAAGFGEAEDWPGIGRQIANHCTPPPVLPLLYFDEIAPALESADLVEGLLTDGGMSVFYGESGSGKTFFALDLALHVAAGTTWRGRAVERGAVLYLALEGSHGIRNRVSAFKASNHVQALPFAVVPVSLNLLDPAADTMNVIEAARAAAARLDRRVRMIVVDTLSRALAGGNENGPEDMTAFVGNMDRIRLALPSAVAIVHHSGKDAARGARGHGSLRAATDTEIEVSRDAFTNISTAKVTKQRDMDCEGEFPFRLESVHLGMNGRGKPVTSCVVKPITPEQAAAQGNGRVDDERREKIQRQMEADRRSVLSAIDGESKVHGAATKNAIRSLAGLGQGKVNDALAALLESGEIEQVPIEKKAGQGAKLATTGYRRLASHEHPSGNNTRSDGCSATTDGCSEEQSNNRRPGGPI